MARYVQVLAERYIPNWHVMLVYRTDRFGRGGDHTAFNQLGYPAVRLTESHEDFTHQHQDVRVVDGIQYGDLITRLIELALERHQDKNRNIYSRE